MVINNEQSLKTTLGFAGKFGGTVATFRAYSFFMKHVIQGHSCHWGSQITDKKQVFYFLMAPPSY